jgi:MFS superfamily sulfate permease-like transporter
LAAILIVVGFKLTTPKLILEMKKLGNEQFIPFAVTILAILFTDLLVGIGIGMAVGIFFILRLNYKLPYRLISDSGDGKTIPNKSTFILSEHVSFLNKAALQKALMEVQENTHVVIDGSNAIKIDFDALEVIHDFKISAVNRGITLQIIQVRGLEILDEVKRSGH